MSKTGPARTIFEPEHEEFRAFVREFLEREVAPHHDRWEEQGRVDKEFYAVAAEKGIVGFWVPQEYGGLGIEDFRYNVVIQEELGKLAFSAPSIRLYNDIIAPYLLNLTNDEQKQRWLPGQAKGTFTFSLGLSEPGAGSDLAGARTSAVRDGDGWIVNGSKIFITNGLNSDATIVFCKTNPDAGHRGFSLLVVEDGMEGFKRGRKLRKMGMAGQDTAELFFEDVRVPAANLLGEEGQGFYYLMMNLGVERLAIALAALSQARQVFDDTLDYVKTREAFKQPIGTFQANKHVMATFATELDIAQVYVDSLIVKVLDGTLSDIEASKAKWWVTEVGKRVIDGCLQLHGGYGYMLEYPVAKAYIDYRYMTIGGGSTEIMKEMIGNDLGLAWRKRG